MIEIKRDGTKVKVVIDSRMPLDASCFAFTFDAGSEFAACLLAEKLQFNMESQIKQIRQDAYENGWKDKLRHRSKQTWFSADINSKYM